MEKSPYTLSKALLAEIVEAIRAIRFGSVQITIHDSRVVQIEKAEKIRFPEADLVSGDVRETIGRSDRTTGGSPRDKGH